MRTIRDFYKDEGGATAIEYGLLAALIGVGILVSLRSLGTGTEVYFGNWTNEVKNATQ